MSTGVVGKLNVKVVRDLLDRLIQPESDPLKEQLWQALPAVYRERDDQHDLEKPLDAFGSVLDGVRATLDQRLRDISPLTCQPWLLPYFADLLDVRLLSPHEQGRRQEIANAIRWRQGKGTFATCVEVAEAIGQYPIIAYEGHESVATTPRADRWVRPELGIRAVSVDFRRLSVPTRVDVVGPRTFTSNFDGDEVLWERELPPYGAPCHRGNGYHVVNLHTVDTRGPSWEHGHHHPKRLRLFTPVPLGFIKHHVVPQRAVGFLMSHIAPPAADDPEWRSVHSGGKELRYLVRSATLQVQSKRYVRVDEHRSWIDGSEYMRRSTLIAFTEAAEDIAPALPESWSDWKINTYLLQMENSQDTTTLRGGAWDLSNGRPGTAGEPLPRRGHLYGEIRWPTMQIIRFRNTERPQRVIIEQLCVSSEIIGALDRLELSRVGVRRVSLSEGATLSATDSLIHTLKTWRPGGRLGEVTLEYCTVSSSITCAELRASDSILLGAFEEDDLSAVKLRYSCAPQLPASIPQAWRVHEASISRRWPELFSQIIHGDGRHELDEARFGEPGFGVMHQVTHPSIRRGAEDGGELGAYHHRHYCGRQDAVLDKLAEFLPAGMVPVLTVDPHWQAPLPRRTK